MMVCRNEEAGNKRISVEQALSISEDLRDLHKYRVELKNAMDGNDLASLRVCLVCWVFQGDTVIDHETGTSRARGLGPCSGRCRGCPRRMADMPVPIFTHFEAVPLDDLQCEGPRCPPEENEYL